MVNLRAIDALVAEKVMGLPTGEVVCRECDGNGRELGDEESLEKCMTCYGSGKKLVLTDHYSSSISDAWQVVEKLKIAVVGQFNHGWGVWVESYPNCDDAMGVTQDPDACAETAPLAICLAALKAVGVDPGSTAPSDT